MKKYLKKIVKLINNFFLNKKIIFYHIPKSGGTSFETFFKKFYNDKNIVKVYPESNFNEEIKKNPKKKIFYGHVGYQDIDDIENCFQFTVLRNPLEIYRSEYYFLKGFNKQYNRSEITSIVQIENLSFENYLMRKKKYYNDNMITRYFSNKLIYKDIFDRRFFKKINKDENGQLNDDDYKLALFNLKKINVYIFENLNRKMIYKRLNTKLYFSNIVTNKTIIREKLSKSQLEMCRKINNYDLKIYEEFKNLN